MAIHPRPVFGCFDPDAIISPAQQVCRMGQTWEVPTAEALTSTSGRWFLGSPLIAPCNQHTELIA